MHLLINLLRPPKEYPRYGYESPRYQPAFPSYSSRKAVQIEEYDNEESLPDDILCLTPPTHLGWSFTAKAWGLILVEHLSDIVFDELAFDQLVVRPEYKKMIKALVETHAGQNDGLARDLVAGKGGGMVMVLHGKPGLYSCLSKFSTILTLRFQQGLAR